MHAHTLSYIRCSHMHKLKKHSHKLFWFAPNVMCNILPPSLLAPMFPFGKVARPKIIVIGGSALSFCFKRERREGGEGGNIE